MPITLTPIASSYKSIKDISIYKNLQRKNLVRIKKHREKSLYTFILSKNLAVLHPFPRKTFENYATTLAIALKVLKDHMVPLSEITIERPMQTYYIDTEIQNILEAEGVNINECRGVSFETTAPIIQPQHQTPITITRRPSIEELAASMRQISERI
jgi:hypothetical protein